MENQLEKNIEELNTKGTLLEQAEWLCDEDKRYKKVIRTYQEQLKEMTDVELAKELNSFLKKYEDEQNEIRREMCVLNRRILDTFNIIEKEVSIEPFIKIWGLKEDEIDEKEGFYKNLMTSSTKAGYVVRTALIESERLVKSLLD